MGPKQFRKWDGPKAGARPRGDVDWTCSSCKYFVLGKHQIACCRKCGAKRGQVAPKGSAAAKGGGKGGPSGKGGAAAAGGAEGGRLGSPGAGGHAVKTIRAAVGSRDPVLAQQLAGALEGAKPLPEPSSLALVQLQVSQLSGKVSAKRKVVERAKGEVAEAEQALGKAEELVRAKRAFLAERHGELGVLLLKEQELATEATSSAAAARL